MLALNQEMTVVWHDAVSEDVKTFRYGIFPKKLEEPLATGWSLENWAALIAAEGDEIKIKTEVVMGERREDLRWGRGMLSIV
jgi:hypothetical protein